MKRKAQVILETALVLAAVAIFIVGIMRVWAWFVQQYGDRWETYNRGRVRAGKIATYQAGGFVPDGYKKEKLDLFK